MTLHLNSQSTFSELQSLKYVVKEYAKTSIVIKIGLFQQSFRKLYKIYCFLTSLIGRILYVGVPKKYTYPSFAKFPRVKKHYFTKVAYIFFRITPWESPFRSSSISLCLLPVPWKKSPRAKAPTAGTEGPTLSCHQWRCWPSPGSSPSWPPHPPS